MQNLLQQHFTSGNRNREHIILSNQNKMKKNVRHIHPSRVMAKRIKLQPVVKRNSFENRMMVLDVKHFYPHSYVTSKSFSRTISPQAIEIVMNI